MSERSIHTCIILFLCTLLLSACTAKAEYDAVLSKRENSASTGTLHPVSDTEEPEITVTVSRSSDTYHVDPTCRFAVRISAENRRILSASPQALARMGYTPCSVCAAEFGDGSASPDEETEKASQEDSASAQAVDLTDTQTSEEHAARDAQEEYSPDAQITIILNRRTKVVHFDSACRYVRKMKNSSKMIVTDSAAHLLAEGYRLCSACAPT